MSDDPDKYRRSLRVKLLEMADTMPLAAMTPAPRGQGSRFVRETNHTVLTNSPRN